MPKLNDDEKEFQHESYGTIGFSRINGNVGRLFGSSLESHRSSIRIRIHEAECVHAYGTDRYFQKKELIEVELSAVQFAEFITTSNAGTGVPCTIRRLQGKRLEDPPGDVSAEVGKVRDSFREKMEKLAGTMDTNRKRARELLSQKSLKTAEREELLGLMERVFQEVEFNTPFMLDQFEEAAERVVLAAKAEVDAFATHHIMAEGIRAIQAKAEKAKAHQLPENASDDEE